MSNKWTECLVILAAVILPNIFPFIYGISDFNQRTIKEWYQLLEFPWYRPPDWIFGPVWVALYSLMGYASYLVWKDGNGFKGPARWPLVWYIIQLALNWAWTPVFFGARQLGWAAVLLLAILIAAGVTTWQFHKVRPLAGYLLVPYLAWLSFALNLNFQIWRLNRENLNMQ